MGGKIFEEIRAKKPENTDIQFVMSVITRYKETLSGGVAVKNVDSDVFNQVVSSSPSSSSPENKEEKEKIQKSEKEEKAEKIQEKEAKLKEEYQKLENEKEEMKQQLRKRNECRSSKKIC